MFRQRQSNGTTTIRWILTRLVVMLSVTGAAVIGVQTPALAAYDSVKIYAPYRGTASSARHPVEAHNSEHWVQVRAHTASSLLLVVKDMDNNDAVVFRGIPNHSNWITILGLYGERYKLEATGVYNGGNATIRNCTSGCNDY
jgi:hypothetical protein